jgi:hypothetical protein
MKKICQKLGLMLMAAIILLLPGCYIIDINNQLAGNLIPQSTDKYKILSDESKALFLERKPQFSPAEWDKGPCLGRLNDNYVVDVVHSPRTAVDDDLKNQCGEYYAGTVKYYILLNYDGDVVAMKMS